MQFWGGDAASLFPTISYGSEECRKVPAESLVVRRPPKGFPAFPVLRYS